NGASPRNGFHLRTSNFGVLSAREAILWDSAPNIAAAIARLPPTEETQSSFCQSWLHSLSPRHMRSLARVAAACSTLAPVDFFLRKAIVAEPFTSNGIMPIKTETGAVFLKLQPRTTATKTS